MSARKVLNRIFLSRNDHETAMSLMADCQYEDGISNEAFIDAVKSLRECGLIIPILNSRGDIISFDVNDPEAYKKMDQQYINDLHQRAFDSETK